MPTPRTLRALGPIMSIAALAACSSPGSTASRAQQRALGPIPIVRSSAELRGPLDAYSLSTADRWQISVANRITDWNCLKRKGFTVPLTSIPIAQVSDDDSYGYLKFLDTAKAARYGYHLPPAPQPPGTQVIHPLFGGLPAAQTAWQNGCQSIVDQVRSHRFDLPIDPLRGVQTAIVQSQTDSRYHAITRRWSTCMSHHGYPYKTPFDAINAKPWGLTDPSGQSRGPITKLETSTAMADAQCREETNFLGWWKALLTTYENQFIKSRRTELATARNITQEQLKKALQTIRSQQPAAPAQTTYHH